MAIDTTGGGTTVAVVLPVMPFWVAEIVTGLEVVPTPVATPLTVMVILVVSDDDHVAVSVIFCVVESLKVPVAVNGCWVWKTMAGFGGVTAMETRVADVTVKVAGGLVTDPNVAVMDVVPEARPPASPCVPGALLIVATVAIDEAHVTLVVMF